MTFFINAMTSARLVQHFFGERFELISMNQLRLETLFFGVGNQFGARQRFGIART